MGDVYSLLRAIRAKQLTRNRNFAVHASSAGKRARALDRFLRSIEQDLLDATAITLERCANSWTLKCEFPALRLRRQMTLDEMQLGLLVENTACRERLRTAAGDDERTATLLQRLDKTA